jgi:hypothetical protein
MLFVLVTGTPNRPLLGLNRSAFSGPSLLGSNYVILCGRFHHRDMVDLLVVLEMLAFFRQSLGLGLNFPSVQSLL